MRARVPPAGDWIGCQKAKGRAALATQPTKFAMHLKNWELTQAREGRNRGCGVVVEAYTAKRRLQLQHTPGSTRGGSGHAKKAIFLATSTSAIVVFPEWVAEQY